MKLTLTTLAAMLLTSAAFAGPFGLPDHEKDGRYDNGCDVTQNVPIPNSNAFSNSSCPVGGGGAVYPQGKPVGPKPETPVDPAPPVDEPTDPETPDDGGPVVTPDPADPPVVDPAPECRGDCNNGHGNDEDGDDEGNPGKSK